MDMCFACIATVLTNHSGWRNGSYKYKNCCVLCMELVCLIEMCDLLIIIVYIVSRGVQFSNMPQNIWTAGSFQCSISFPIHCSMTILHTYAVCYIVTYIIVGVGYYTDLEGEC